MVIETVSQITDELLAALERLIPQLTSNHPPPTPEALRELISSEASTLLAARYPNARAPIVGVLTLVLYRVPTGTRARIEDVVVDEEVRGKGIGERLVRQALDLAREAGADGVALTSNPKREAANRLYQRLGFKPWETNLYFFKF
jgi:ribosomal protein S18 acetylase RimI-like enzyme